MIDLPRFSLLKDKNSVPEGIKGDETVQAKKRLRRSAVV
jgi:hypothetical protein